MPESLRPQTHPVAGEALSARQSGAAGHLGDAASLTSVEIFPAGDLQQPDTAVMGVHRLANGELDLSAATRVSFMPKDRTPHTESPATADGQPEGVFTGVRRLPNGELDWSSAASVSLVPKTTERAPEQTDAVTDDREGSSEKTITAKSNELLQAQVASFARKSGYHEGQQLFQRMGNLDRTPNDITYADRNDPEVARTIRRQSYVDHLRELRGSKDEAMQVRVSALEAYKEFAPEVTDWLRTIRVQRQNPDFDTHEQHPAYLDEAAYNTAFAFAHNGKEYVAKFSNNTKDAGFDVDEVALDLSVGKGVPHLEQLVAISYEDGVAISERMSGKDFTKLSAEDIEQIPDEQLSQALHTMKEAAERGIFFDDANASNYFYDKVDGFGFIDYANIKHSILLDPEIHSDSEMAVQFVENLIGVNRSSITRESTHEQTPRELNARIALLQRYRAVCERTMHAENLDYAEAMHKVDELITQYDRFLNAPITSAS
jgi:hypothetical protein